MGHSQRLCVTGILDLDRRSRLLLYKRVVHWLSSLPELQRYLI